MWDEIQAIGGFAGLVAVAAAAWLTERMRRVFATSSDLKAETRNRETADGHIDRRVEQLSRDVMNYMGRIDLLREQMTEQDRAREREVAALREEVRTGFARIMSRLDRNNQQGG